MKTDVTIVAPRVRGHVAQVLVGDNQPVKAGQVLVRLDPEEYAARVAAAQGDLAIADAAIASAEAALARLGSSRADGRGRGARGRDRHPRRRRRGDPGPGRLGPLRRAAEDRLCARGATPTGSQTQAVAAAAAADKTRADPGRQPQPGQA